MKLTKAEKTVYLLVLAGVVAMAVSILAGVGFGVVVTVIVFGGILVLVAMPFVLGKGRSGR